MVREAHTNILSITSKGHTFGRRKSELPGGTITRAREQQNLLQRINTVEPIELSQCSPAAAIYNDVTQHNTTNIKAVTIKRSQLFYERDSNATITRRGAYSPLASQPLRSLDNLEVTLQRRLPDPSEAKRALLASILGVYIPLFSLLFLFQLLSLYTLLSSLARLERRPLSTSNCQACSGFTISKSVKQPLLNEHFLRHFIQPLQIR